LKMSTKAERKIAGNREKTRKTTLECVKINFMKSFLFFSEISLAMFRSILWGILSLEVYL
jgi:hypothetical protein